MKKMTDYSKMTYLKKFYCKKITKKFLMYNWFMSKKYECFLKIKIKENN